MGMCFVLLVVPAANQVGHIERKVSVCCRMRTSILTDIRIRDHILLLSLRAGERARLHRVAQCVPAPKSHVPLQYVREGARGSAWQRCRVYQESMITFVWAKILVSQV